MDMYLLSQHPEAEAKLHGEIDAVLDGRHASADDVARLRYTEMVLAESMRLYPPAWTLGRRVLSDYREGRYIIPGNSIVLMSPWVMHHDSLYYPEPFMAGTGALLAMIIIALINMRYQPEFWREMNASFKIEAGDAPLGERRLKEMRSAQK